MITSLQFRKCVGRFATGVTVVTVRNGEDFHGMTANAFASVSLDPPLVVVIIDNRAYTRVLVETVGHFTVNVLTGRQQAISARFATPHLHGSELFNGLACRDGVTGDPVIVNALAYVSCMVTSTHQEGDHTLCIGRVVDLGYGPQEEPLIFYEGQYRGLGDYRSVGTLDSQRGVISAMPTGTLRENRADVEETERYGRGS